MRGLPAGRSVAAMAGVAVIGAAGGWYLRYLQTSAPDLTDGSVAFVNLGPTLRGPADCSVVTLEAAAVALAVRVPGAEPGLTLAATRLDGSALTAGSYRLRTQSDGSWLVQVAAKEWRGEGVHVAYLPIDGAIESERTRDWLAKNGADRAIPQAAIADPELAKTQPPPEHDAVSGRQLDRSPCVRLRQELTEQDQATGAAVRHHPQRGCAMRQCDEEASLLKSQP